MSVPVGKTVAIELTALPRSAAARKTLVRLFAKEPQVVRAERWRYRHRPSLQTWRRGGNYWHHQMKTRPLFDLKVGRRVSLLATLDIARDLASVERYLKITAR
jgi:hypothetical protein